MLTFIPVRRVQPYGEVLLCPSVGDCFYRLRPLLRLPLVPRPLRSHVLLCQAIEILRSEDSVAARSSDTAVLLS